MIRVLVVFLIALLLFAHVDLVVRGSDADVTQTIVPGSRIGRVRLGITEDRARVVDRAKDVYVAYVRGRAATLFTPWGGAYATVEGIGVGSGVESVRTAYGSGRESGHRRIYGYAWEATIYCLWYDRIGVGFTMLSTKHASGVTGVWVYRRGTKALEIPVEWNCGR